jgi:hypothetical protein
VRGKTMPQHVRRDIALDATPLDPLFDSQPQGDACKGRPSSCEEDIGR